MILFPETGEVIQEEILRQAQDDNFKIKSPLRGLGGVGSQGEQNPPTPLVKGGSFFPVKNMQECVKMVYEVTQKDKICLLSPASPSYNLFKNFQERGSLYKKFIQEYVKNI